MTKIQRKDIETDHFCYLNRIDPVYKKFMSFDELQMALKDNFLKKVKTTKESVTHSLTGILENCVII